MSFYQTWLQCVNPHYHVFTAFISFRSWKGTAVSLHSWTSKLPLKHAVSPKPLKKKPRILFSEDLHYNISNSSKTQLQTNFTLSVPVNSVKLLLNRNLSKIPIHDSSTLLGSTWFTATWLWAPMFSELVATNFVIKSSALKNRISTVSPERGDKEARLKENS